MNRRGSSGGGGAASDVESERGHLVGTVFLGAIVVAVDYKYAKNAHQTRAGDEGAHKQRVKEKKWIAAGIDRSLKYDSLHHSKGSLRYSEAILRSDEGLIAAAKIRASQRRSRLRCCGLEGGFKIVLPPQRRSKLRRGGSEMLRLYFFPSTEVDHKVWETVFLPSAFKTHLSIKNKHR